MNHQSKNNPNGNLNKSQNTHSFRLRCKQQHPFSFSRPFKIHFRTKDTTGVWVCKCVFTIKGNICHRGRSKAGSEVSRGSWVVSAVELGQEVLGTRLFALVEESHDVGLLLPDVDRLLELHLPLERK